MEKIESFKVDHTKIEKGMYISRVDDDIITYDIRMVKPNTPPYLENAALHSFEHLFATFARNSIFSKHVIYVGPMGCRTGFYLILRDLSHKNAINLVKEALEYIASFSGTISGSNINECGNYLSHDLTKAKHYAKEMYATLEHWTVADLIYKD